MASQIIIEPYISLGQLGEGTYGKVFKAQNRQTKEVPALLTRSWPSRP